MSEKISTETVFFYLRVIICLSVLTTTTTITSYIFTYQNVVSVVNVISPSSWFVQSHIDPTHHVIPVQRLSIENKTHKSIVFYRNISLADEGKVFANTCTSYNWSDILKPCESKLAWEKREKDRTKQTSVLHSKIEVEVRPVGYTSRVKIYTKDALGRKKNYGGDSWVIKVEGKDYRRWFHPKDRLDGSYEGMFAMEQTGVFHLTVTLDFSLCDGLLDPPTDFFRRGLAEPNIALGETHKFIFMMKDFLHITSESIKFDVQKTDIIPVRKKSDLGGLPHNQCGYWANGTFHTYDETTPTKHLDLNKINGTVFDQQKTLLLGGDSVNRNFYNNIKEYGVCETIFENCINHYSWIYKRIDQRINHAEGHDLDLREFIKYQIDDRFNKTHCTWCSKKSYHVVNFGFHLSMRVSFRELTSAFQLFLKVIKELKEKIGEKNFPTVIWKTTSPTRFEAISPNYNIRFMSRPRVYLWNVYTTSEARKAGLPVLDSYDMALSSINGHIDQSHHHNWVFTRLIEQLMEMVLKTSKNTKSLDQLSV